MTNRPRFNKAEKIEKILTHMEKERDSLYLLASKVNPSNVKRRKILLDKIEYIETLLKKYKK